MDARRVPKLLTATGEGTTCRVHGSNRDSVANGKAVAFSSAGKTKGRGAGLNVGDFRDGFEPSNQSFALFLGGSLREVNHHLV
jgi:hypothetical protein